MALTAYDAIQPTMRALKFSGTGVAVSSAVINPSGVLFINDHVVITVTTLSSGSVDPTGILVNGQACTKMFSANGISFWAVKASATVQNPTITVTYSLGATFEFSGNVIGGAVSFVAGGGASGTNITNAANMTTGGNTSASIKTNSMLVALISMKHTVTTIHTAPALIFKDASPPSLGSFQNWLSITNASLSGNARIFASTNGEEVPVPGTNTPVCAYNIRESSANNSDYAGLIVAFQGAQVSLDNNSMQFGDTGVLLNNPSNTLPIYDIDSIAGLSDMTVVSTQDNIDGADGSYVTAKFASGKTIVVNGTIYGTSPFDEILLDNLRQSLRNRSDTGISLYHKPNNQNPRRINVKPISFKSDIDRGRALSTVPYEIQAYTVDSTTAALLPNFWAFTSGGFAISAPNTGVIPSGSDEAYPVFYILVTSTDLGAPGTKMTFVNPTWDTAYPTSDGTTAIVSVDMNLAIAGSYKLDFKTRSLTYYTIPTIGPSTVSTATDVSNLLVDRKWWTIIPDIANYVVISKPSVVFTNDLMAVSDAWL